MVLSVFYYYVVIITAKDCLWSDWSPWSDCRGSCSNSDRTRSRSIISQPKYGGKVCESNGNEEIEQCTNSCICEWTQWSPWSECSQPCGGGISNRTRTPLNDYCQTSLEPLITHISCSDFPCLNRTSSN